MDVVEKVSDKIVLIDKGTIIANDTIEALREGSSNSLETIFAQMTSTGNMNETAGNILQAMQDKSPVDKVVHIETGLSEGMIYIRVADNGPGIPAEQRSQVFNKFYQIVQSKKSNVGGSGLGLSICKKIIDLHKGQIFVDESSSGGAKFILQIPMK